MGDAAQVAPSLGPLVTTARDARLATSIVPNLDASAKSILPNLDGSFHHRLRRVSSEADPERRRDASHYDRSDLSSAVVSTGDRFASLAHFVAARNPEGLAIDIKSDHHSAIVKHFQLRLVSGDDKSARKHLVDKSLDDLDTSFVVARKLIRDGSLATLFAQRRLLKAQSMNKTRDSINSMRKLAHEKHSIVEVAHRSRIVRYMIQLKRRVTRCAYRVWMRPFSPTGKVAAARGIVIVLTLSVQLFYVPFAPVYFPHNTSGTVALALVFDAVYLLDLLVSINTSYFDQKTGRLETSRRKVFTNYIKS